MHGTQTGQWGSSIRRRAGRIAVCALVLASVPASAAQANLGMFGIAQDDLIDDAGTQIVALYSSGREVDPVAISPDGKFIAVTPASTQAELDDVNFDRRPAVYVIPWQVLKLIRPFRADRPANATARLEVTLPPLPSTPVTREPGFSFTGSTPDDLTTAGFYTDLTTNGQTVVYGSPHPFGMPSPGYGIFTRAVSGGPASGDLNEVAGIDRPEAPRWSPNESRIAVSNTDRREIWTMARDGSDARKIFDGPAGAKTPPYSAYGWLTDDTFLVGWFTGDSFFSYRSTVQVIAADGSQRVLRTLVTPEERLFAGQFKRSAIPTLPIPPETRVTKDSLSFSGRLAKTNKTLRVDAVCSGSKRCTGVLVLTYKGKRILRYAYRLSPTGKTVRRTFKLRNSAQRAMRKAPKFSYPKARIGGRSGPGSDIRVVQVRRF